MITEIAEAIMQQFNGNVVLKNALTSGMFYEQASEELTGDYCVFYVRGGTKDEIMGAANNCLNNLDIQFNLFSDADDGGETIAALHSFLSSCYDWVVLKVDSFGCFKMEPVSFAVIPVMDGWRQISVIYELGIQKE